MSDVTISGVSSFVIIHNPSSRRGQRVARKVARSPELLRKAGDRSWVKLSQIDRAPIPSERLVVIGGDGTVNRAATWLDEHELDRPLAIIPSGTGDNFARGLGIPLSTTSACRLAFAGSRLQTIDAVRYRTRDSSRSRLMLQVAALGFPAEIAARYDRLRQNVVLGRLFRPLGTQVYRFLALLDLASQKRRERRGDGQLQIRVKLGATLSLVETVFALFLGNEKSVGGGFVPCPRAAPDDGMIDVCMIRAGTGERYLTLLNSVTKGRHLKLEHSVLYRQSRGPVELSLTEPARMVVDGELVEASDHFQFEVVPGRFRVVLRDG